MSRTVLLFVVCVALCSSLSSAASRFTDADYEREFTAWMHTHLKSYSATEFGARFAKFKANLDYCADFNSRNNSFTVGVNVFSDLDVSEFRNLLLKPIPQLSAHDLQNVPEFTGEGVKVSRAAANIDWRTKGAVQAIKNQGQCGSCWTFSGAAAIESINQIQTGVLTSLSEQQLLDCTTQSNSGCNGGSFMAAFSYVNSNGGLDTESSYPYEGAQGSCRYVAANKGGNINGYSRVTANDENALLTALQGQPISVGIQADLQSFQQYKSGIYADSSCTSAGIDHAVLLVGAGTDANNADYWIIKNSWGTGWGQSGYIQMQRGTNMCGIAAQAAFPTRTSTTSTTGAASTTTAKPATTGSATTGSTTARPATTGSSSTTGGSRSGNIFVDSLASGWSLAAYGTVSGQSTSATGQSGTAISATIAPNSALALVSNPALSLTPFTTFKFSVKSTGSALTVSIGSAAASTSGLSSAYWRTVSAGLSTFGSPTSASVVSFSNPSSSSITVTLDNIMFS